MCAAPFSPHLGECELIQAKTFLGAVLALEEYGRLVEMAEKWSSCLICYNSFSTPQNSHSQKWQWQHNWILFSPWNPAGCSQTSPVLLKTCPTTTMSSTQPAFGRNTHESIYNYWSDFSVYYLYILEVCVIHTEFSWGFFFLHFSFWSAENLSDHYKQLFWFHTHVEGTVWHKEWRCSRVFQVIFGFLTSNTWGFFLYSIWNHGKQLFLGLWNFKNEKKGRGRISIARISPVQQWYQTRTAGP